MFLSYKYNSNDAPLFVFTIVDTDFEQTLEVPTGTGVLEWIAREYDKRNLPVAPNLCLAFLFLKKTFGFEDIPSTAVYKEAFEAEIDKYRILL